MRSLQLNFTDELLESAVLASNAISLIKNHDQKSLGLKNQGAGGHSRNSFSEKDKVKVQRWIISKAPFEKRNVDVVYTQALPFMYSNVVIEAFKLFVGAKKRDYALHKTP